MLFIIPTGWTDYELIDTGRKEKLERFGKYILIRPEPQAIWSKALPEEEWDKLSHARFTRRKSSDQEPAIHRSRSSLTRSPHHPLALSSPDRKEERGEWIKKSGMPDQWWIGYKYKEMQLKFRLGLTAFGHIGVFPEQAENWKFIYDAITRTGEQAGSRATRRRILNLFAYTGGSSLAALAAGAGVVHVDSVKQVISWAREDMEASGLDGICWVVEDALKFTRREAKRGNLYNGIILDPPAYGRGPEGEKWQLEDSINELISLCGKILNPDSSFFVLSLYSMGFSPLIGENLLKTHFGRDVGIESGEFCFTDRAGRRLPLGIFARF